jgi:hypothetical protein
MTIKVCLGLVLAAALGACGGGGNDSPAIEKPVANAAEGFWEGTSSTGFLVSLVVLENGETWGVYSSGALIVGAVTGNTTTNGSTLSGTGRDFNIASRTVVSGSYSGSFAPKTTINVTTVPTNVHFTGAYRTEYDQSPSLSSLAGTFTGSGVTGTSPVQSISVVVSPSGSISGQPSLGCSAIGTATPRPSGKNIFNVALTFSGSTCALGNGATASGVAYYDVASSKVLVMGLNAAKTDGFIYIGHK